MKNSLFTYLKNKKILILGFGREGRVSLDFLIRHRAELGDAVISVADMNPVDLAPDMQVKVTSGDNYLEAMYGADIVLKSPGISFKQFDIERENDRIYLKQFPGTEISGQMDLFLRFAEGTIVGVSGTKGKSTTTSLTYEILSRNLPRVQLLGNIGIPVMEGFDWTDENTVSVIEMSSHQLEFVSASPQISMLTNFFPEHLDHYRSYKEYIGAKLNLLRFQSSENFSILNANEEELMRKALHVGSAVKLLVAQNDKPVFDNLSVDYMLEDSDRFKCAMTKGNFPEDHMLLGRHMRIDALFACACASVLGIPLERQMEAIRHFRGIPHRLQYVGQYQGIFFYNDSIATIPQATILNIETVREKGPLGTLLLGGMDRGISYDVLAAYLVKNPIRNLILFPDTGKKIADLMKNMGAENQNFFFVEEMEEAVRLAFEHTSSGEVCLLSPAASSYNHYKNFEERGNRFMDAVKQQHG